MEASEDDDIIISAYRRSRLSSRKAGASRNQRSSPHHDYFDSLPNGQGQQLGNDSQNGSAVAPIDLDKAPPKPDDVLEGDDDEELNDTRTGWQQNDSVDAGKSAASDKAIPSSLPSQIPDTYASSDSYLERKARRMKHEAKIDRILAEKWKPELNRHHVQNLMSQQEPRSHEDQTGASEVACNHPNNLSVSSTYQDHAVTSTANDINFAIESTWGPSGLSYPASDTETVGRP